MNRSEDRNFLKRRYSKGGITPIGQSERIARMVDGTSAHDGVRLFKTPHGLEFYGDFTGAAFDDILTWKDLEIFPTGTELCDGLRVMRASGRVIVAIISCTESPTGSGDEFVANILKHDLLDPITIQRGLLGGFVIFAAVDRPNLTAGALSDALVHMTGDPTSFGAKFDANDTFSCKVITNTASTGDWKQVTLQLFVRYDDG